MHFKRFFGDIGPRPASVLSNVTVWKQCGAAWRVGPL